MTTLADISKYGQITYTNAITSGSLTAAKFYQNTSMTSNSQIVDAEEYRELLDERRLLYALIDAGVEDWPGYNEALALYRESEE